MKGDLQENS